MNQYIELTNLKSPSTKEIKKLVEIANKENYYGVCLNSNCLSIANKYRKKNVKLITVAGFPPIYSYPFFKQKNRPNLHLTLGPSDKESIEEIHSIINEGLADELDIVFPMYWYATGKFLRIYKLLYGVRKRFKGQIKVIIELGTLFTDSLRLYEMVRLLYDAGIDFVKTNTGLIPQDYENLKANLWRLKYTMFDMNCSDFRPLPIKASGGIKTKEQVEYLVHKIGVTRIGTSTVIKEK